MGGSYAESLVLKAKTDLQVLLRLASCQASFFLEKIGFKNQLNIIIRALLLDLITRTDFLRRLDHVLIVKTCM